jgi:hypothetical protein
VSFVWKECSVAEEQTPYHTNRCFEYSDHCRRASPAFRTFANEPVFETPYVLDEFAGLGFIVGILMNDAAR